MVNGNISIFERVLWALYIMIWLTEMIKLKNNLRLNRMRDGHSTYKRSWKEIAYNNGYRYGNMTTNMLEVFNNVLKGVCGLPLMIIVQIILFRTKVIFHSTNIFVNLVKLM